MNTGDTEIDAAIANVEHQIETLKVAKRVLLRLAAMRPSPPPVAAPPDSDTSRWFSDGGK